MNPWDNFALSALVLDVHSWVRLCPLQMVADYLPVLLCMVFHLWVPPGQVDEK